MAGAIEIKPRVEARNVAVDCASSQKPSSRSFPQLTLFLPSVSNCVKRGYEVSAYYNPLQRAATWPRHRRQQTEVVVLVGGAVLRIGWSCGKGRWREEEYRGPKVCIIPSGLLHECQFNADAELLVLYIENRLLRQISCKPFKGVFAGAMVHNDIVVWYLTWALRGLFASNAAADGSLIDRIGGGLAERLIRQLRDSSKVPVSKGRQLTTPEFDRVLRFMEAHLHHDIHVDDFAKLTGHTPAHFSLIFKNRTNCSPYQYLKELRMLRAHTMVMSGDHRLREIALKVGYSNLDHFGEVFHRYWKYSARALLTQARRAASNRRV